MSELREEPGRDALLGRWKQIVRRPDPRLAPFVRAYKGYAHLESTPAPSRHVPTGGVALIIGFDDGMRIAGPDTLADYSERRTTFVAGMHDTYTDSQWLGRSYGVQVDFTPLGAYMFFSRPMSEMTNRVLEFTDLLGADATALVERLQETPAWDTRFGVIESFVASRIVAAREPSPEVWWAWQQIALGPSSVSISELAGEIGWSQRHFIQRFREEVGLSPKMAARVLRFDRAVRIADGASRPSWVQVATDAGYYDQSHMVRDFHEFAGSSPTGYLELQRGVTEISPE
jgi:AraC-like DNA-binding protein